MGSRCLVINDDSFHPVEVEAEVMGFSGSKIFQSRAAAAVCYQLDGDSAGAQALAEQYRLRSYPTLVLYAPDGGEITRLPCELDGELFIAAWAPALSPSS